MGGGEYSVEKKLGTKEKLSQKIVSKKKGISILGPKMFCQKNLGKKINRLKRHLGKKKIGGKQIFGKKLLGWKRDQKMFRSKEKF